MDSKAYDSALNLTPAEHKPFAISTNEKDRKALDDKWAVLNDNLKTKFADFEEPSVPYRDDALVKDFNEFYAGVYSRVSQKF